MTDATTLTTLTAVTMTADLFAPQGRRYERCRPLLWTHAGGTPPTTSSLESECEALRGGLRKPEGQSDPWPVPHRT